MSESQSTSAPPTSLEQMESRLAALELKLAGASLPPSENATGGNARDVNSRIDRLTRIETNRRPPPGPLTKSSSVASKAESKRLALHEEFRTIDRLLSDLALSPIAGPTTAAGVGVGNNNAPMVFRRMEILASAESMKRDMDLLARIRDLTLVGTKTSAAGDSGARDVSRVVNCPIISSDNYNLPSDPEAAERLERLCFRVANLNQRTAIASQRADGMVHSYGKIMMALSEKMVLAEEQIIG